MPVNVINFILQLLMSLCVAWCSVFLALGRFKKEKLWERQLEAYTDVATALGAMRLILGRWGDDMEGLRSYSDDDMRAFSGEYRDARLKFERTAAVGKLILSRETAKKLEELARQLEADEASDPFEAYNTKFDVIDAALRVIIVLGRSELRPRRLFRSTATLT